MDLVQFAILEAIVERLSIKQLNMYKGLALGRRRIHAKTTEAIQNQLKLIHDHNYYMKKDMKRHAVKHAWESYYRLYTNITSAKRSAQQFIHKINVH